MQHYRYLKNIITLIFFLIMLGKSLSLLANPIANKDQIRVDSLLNQARTMIRDSVIPSILMVHNDNIKSIIESTEVIVKTGGPFEVYVRPHNGRHKIVIGAVFVFLASIQAETLFWTYVFPEKTAALEEYRTQLLDFTLTGRLIDGFENEFPTVTQYFGWSPKEAESYAARVGGIKAYNIYTNHIMFQILTNTLSHEYAHIYLGHTKQDKNTLSLYERRKNEWHADIQAIHALSSVGLMAPTYMPPIGALLTANLFSYLEDPQAKGTHPSETCRTLYSTDAVLWFGMSMLETEKKLGLPEELLAHKERALNMMNQGYKRKKSEYKLSDICDDFVVLNTFN